MTMLTPDPDTNFLYFCPFSHVVAEAAGAAPAWKSRLSRGMRWRAGRGRARTTSVASATCLSMVALRERPGQGMTLPSSGDGCVLPDPNE
eukprot:scaffold96886_cov33-Tisochrysis_lutea.AAC.1